MERLSQQLEWLAKEYSHVPALLSEQSYLSYYQLHTAFLKACSLLQGLQGQTQRIALVFDNPLLHIIFSLACLRCGFTQFSIDSKDSDDIIKSLLQANNIDLLLSDNQGFEDIGCVIMTVNTQTIAQQKAAVDFPEVDPENKAVLVTGSGSTGEPKQLAFSVREYETSLFERSDPFDIKATERFMSMVPVHFHAGKTRTLLYLLKGATCVFISKPTTPTALILDRLSVQHIYCVDLHLGNLLKQAQSTDTSTAVRFPYLKSLIVSGSPVSVERIHQSRSMLTKRLFIVYGANEVFHVSVATPEDLDRYPHTIGKLVADAQLKLLSPEKQTVDINKTGHAHVITPGMVRSYENNPRATEENFYQGWFMPKDLIHQNEEGYLFFDGRSDDLMIFDGMNIYPIEIESLLDQLPEVKECAAFPLNTQQDGDIPVAAIVLNRPQQKSDETYIMNFLQQQMGKRYPRELFFMDELPRNPRGKILKYQLKELLISQNSV